MKKILFTILWIKLSIFLIIIFAYNLLPFAAYTHHINFVYPPKEEISLKVAFKTWDAQHYLYISEKGYSKKSPPNNAFSPLFPFTIYLFTFITRNSFISGIILANIFSIIGYCLFYVLTRNIYNEKVAYKSLLFLLAFPTSFYFSLIYTESLFFLLVVLFFLYLQKRNLLLAALTAFLLPLTRLIGVAIVIPMLTSYVLEYYGYSVYEQLSVIGKSLLSKKTFFILSPILGLFTAMVIFYIFTGDFFSQFKAQQHFISHYSFFAIFNPLIFLKSFFTFPVAVHGFTNSLLDRAFFLVFLGFLPFLYKRVSKPFFIYAVLFGLLPALGGSFMSYMRYLLVIFPLFICFARMSQEKKYEKFTYPYLYLSILLQGMFIIMHSLNFWVS